VSTKFSSEGGADLKLSHIAPVFASTDVEASLRFCEEKLGFKREWTEGTPVTDAGVRRDSVGLIFAYHPELAERARGTTILIFLSGVEALCAEHMARGAQIIAPLADEDGLRSYTVLLPSGYHLRFAEGLELVRQRMAKP
jgi:hypothetical protein